MITGNHDPQVWFKFVANKRPLPSSTPSLKLFKALGAAPCSHLRLRDDGVNAREDSPARDDAPAEREHGEHAHAPSQHPLDCYDGIPASPHCAPGLPALQGQRSCCIQTHQACSPGTPVWVIVCVCGLACFWVLLVCSHHSHRSFQLTLKHTHTHKRTLRKSFQPTLS